MDLSDLSLVILPFEAQMQLIDILGVAFWVLMYVAAVARIVYSGVSWAFVCRRMYSMLPLFTAVAAFAAFSGFVMGGAIGILGNMLIAALWGTWCALVWAPAIGAKTLLNSPPEANDADSSERAAETGLRTDKTE
ncbi:MAG: hypothetical protein U0941_20040 [Planctomycetaceae bacterium]